MTVAQAMHAGIHGYLVKTSPSEHLINAIHAAHTGGMYFDDRARRALEEWALNPTNLTESELNILRLAHKGLDQKGLADAISVSLSTLKRSLQAIIIKLGASSTADAVHEAARRRLI